MTAPVNCPHCGAVLPSDAPSGLCPRCLLRGGPCAPASPAETENWTAVTGAFTAPTPAALSLLFPQLEILELVGQGGMGAVYKARQPALDRVIALKILPHEAERDPAFAERFTREARALARLNHPHIVAVYDFGISGGLYYLLMEYADGITLRQALAQGPLVPSTALPIVAQICQALQFAHDQGVVHRDIKPENILLTRKGEVKVADFGLAKLLGPDPELFTLTATWQVMGTRHYMAPEQEQRPLQVDHRADIYSLGVLCYELLTGERPVGNFVPPSQKSTVTTQFDEVVLRALAPEPERRFQRASDLLDALGKAGETVPSSPIARQLRPRSRRAWLWAGALLAGVLLSLLLFNGWRRAPVLWSGAELRYGGDEGGGAPYIYEEQGRRRGFEVELAHYLGDKLGLNAEFVQKEWNMLPQDLKRGDIDLILNGYEWSPEREQEMASTIPYYIYRLQLIARRGDTTIRDWNDLRHKPGQAKKRVGVLRGSTAHRYLEKEYGDDVLIDALSQDGTTGVMLKVNQGRPGKGLDATVQDLPAAVYYVGEHREFPDLELKGQAIEPGYYVLFVRKNDTELLNRLNEALREAIRDGTLKKIYGNPVYGLWNDDQERLAEVARDWPPRGEYVPTRSVDFVPTLLKAAGVTVLLSCLSMPLAMLAGMFVAVGRLYGPRWLDWVLGAYVEVLRGTPLLLQLFVIYYLLPNVHIDLPAFWAGVLGLAINYSAYEAENYRAGLLAIPRGQMEAALALGMSKWTTLRRIIIPQAFRIVIPPVTNDFIALFKDTSVCSVIAVTELTGRYQRLLVDNPRLVLELGLMTSVLYLLMSYPLSLAARRLERRRG